MPVIPTFVSKKELTTTPPSAEVSAGAFGVKGAVGAGGEALSKIGETLTKVGEKFQEIQDENQFTTAQVNTQKRLNSLYSNVQSNSDVWSAGDKVQEEINKIRDEESAKIGNQLVKNRFDADFALRAMSYTNKIQDDIRTRQHEAMSGMAMDFISGEKENYYNAGTPADRVLALDNMNIKINEMVGRGIWNADKAQKFREELKTEINVGLAASDMDLDPQATLIELKKGKEGAYPDIPHDERLKLTDRAETQIQKADRIAEKNIIIAKNKNESDNLNAYRQIIQTKDGFTQNKLTTQLIDKVNKEADAKLIDSNFAVGLIKALNSPRTVNAKQDNATYEEIMTDIANRDLTATQIRTKILNAYANGKLTQGNVDHFLYMEKGSGDTTVFEDYLSEKDKKPKSNFWGTAWNLIKSTVFPISAVSSIMDSTAKRVQAEGAIGDKIVDIAKEEIDKNVKLTNPNKTKYAVGDYVPLPNGKLFKVSGFTPTGAPTGKIVSGQPNNNITK